MIDDILRRVQDALLNGDNGDQNYDRPRPASKDPYGDPADQMYGGIDEGQFGNVRPASEDPYGDPADQYMGNRDRFGNVRPASEDPYGDPADQESGY